MVGKRLTIHPFGDPLFSGGGGVTHQMLARMAWSVVLVPSRCTEPLRRWGPATNGWPSREGSDFPTNFPDGEVGKIIDEPKCRKKGGICMDIQEGMQHSIFVAVPTCHLLKMWRFVGLVEIFYWLVRDLTIETNPLRVINKNPFQMGIIFIGPEHIFEIDLNTTWTRIHFFTMQDHASVYCMHIHLSNIL